MYAVRGAGIEHGPCDDRPQLRHAGLADAPARDLAGGAAEHDEAAGREVACGAEGVHGGAQGGADFRGEGGGIHEKDFLYVGICGDQGRRLQVALRGGWFTCFAVQKGLAVTHRQVTLRSLTAFFFDRFAMGER